MEKIKKIENEEFSIISRSINKKIFDKVCELFCENYKEEKAFIKYFKSTYYEKNSNWNLGFQKYILDVQTTYLILL